MHVLRSERVGTLWCGLAVLACLCVEGWKARYPRELEPLSVREVLEALESMAGPEVPNLTGDSALSHQTATRARKFPSANGAIRVADLDSAGWTHWGLSPKQARAAVRYNAAVGGINDESTLRRMRVLPDGWFDHFAPVLHFDAERPESTSSGRSAGARLTGTNRPGHSSVDSAAMPESGRVGTAMKAAIPLNINTADSLSLLSVKGIGPWVTGRILSARRRWGGFAEMGQLTEALDGWDSLATALSPLLYCSEDAVQCRCADTLTLLQWRALPGVGQKTAQVLQRYVRHNGGGLPGPLLAHPILDSTQSALLSHYLCPCQQE
mgnify:FL=1